MSGSVLRLPPIAAHALWAGSYDADPNPLLSLEMRVVEPLLPSLEGAFVLDVACGTGRWLRKLVERGAKLAVGLDLSRQMLDVGQTKPDVSGRLVEGDAVCMPVRSASADFVICSFGLSYVRDLPRFAGELSRVVRREAHLVITDFHPAAEARGWRRRFRYQGGTVEIASIPRSLESVCDGFSKAGLELVCCVESGFGEPERAIFERCGKANLFREVRGGPAVFACLLRGGRARRGRFVSSWSE